jgi:hypothetical protein
VGKRWHLDPVRVGEAVEACRPDGKAAGEVSGPGPIRVVRRMLAVLLAANLAFVVLDGFTGRLIGLINVAAVICLALLIRYQTTAIRRMDRQQLAQLRPHPDYSAIAAMERDIYGETFKHRGAPEERMGTLASGLSRLLDMETKRPPSAYGAIIGHWTEEAGTVTFIDRASPVSIGGGGTGMSSVISHNHGPADPCPDDCPSLYVNPSGGRSWMERHDHRASEPCGPMCPGNPAKPGGNGGRSGIAAFEEGRQP